MSGLGAIGEDLAAVEYQKSGFEIIARNYKSPTGKQVGEIDLVALDKHGKGLIFVEVKTRRSGRFGTPFEAVDTGKQRKLVKTAKLFILHHPEYADYSYRIDVAAVDIDNPDNPVIILANAIEDLD